MERARSRPVEILVPALNESDHGLSGNVGATPGRFCGGSVKKRTSGWNADAGEPGGSAS